MMASQIKRFKYKPSAIGAALMVLAVLAVTVGMGWIAYTKPDVLITRRFVRMLSPEMLPFLYWGLTVFGLVLSGIVLWAAIRSQTGLGYVELGQSSALVPNASLSMSPITIPYGAITKVQIIASPQGLAMAIISSSVGESRLFSTAFAMATEFKNFLKELQEYRTDAFLSAPSHDDENKTNEIKVSSQKEGEPLSDVAKKEIALETILIECYKKLKPAAKLLESNFTVFDESRYKIREARCSALDYVITKDGIVVHEYSPDMREAPHSILGPLSVESFLNKRMVVQIDMEERKYLGSLAEFQEKNYDEAFEKARAYKAKLTESIESYIATDDGIKAVAWFLKRNRDNPT